jgi:hypothetical protein
LRHPSTNSWQGGVCQTSVYPSQCALIRQRRWHSFWWRPQLGRFTTQAPERRQNRWYCPIQTPKATVLCGYLYGINGHAHTGHCA